MGQVNKVLRRGVDAYFHWCPACEEMHPLPDRWNFDGNLEKPSFTPSFKHLGFKKKFIKGKWVDWERDLNDDLIPSICHYILTAGILNFCSDCTHILANKSVPLPNIPEGLRDEDF